MNRENTNQTKASPNIVAVIPCYRETGHVLKVIKHIGPEVSKIVVVDDGCPENTGDLVEKKCPDKRTHILRHSNNLGVGAATITGYQKALALGADIIVKIDGDGQMDPKLIPNLIRPIIEGNADYVKGNRFHRLDAIYCMPLLRIIGNTFLSFLTKVSSGYWSIFDPTNGFTAIHGKIAKILPFHHIAKGYFFETDMLFRLGTLKAVVKDMPMQAIYSNETSHLRISRILSEFLIGHLKNSVKRIFISYFLTDFTLASVELLLSILLYSFGLFFGIPRWFESIDTGIPATAGEVILAALPIILGTQLLIAFLNYDFRKTPKNPIHPSLH